MRLSRLLLTPFYLTGPLLIIWELFTPALSIPVLLLSIAYIVMLARFLVATVSPIRKCGEPQTLSRDLQHSRSASPGFITPALEASPFAGGIT